MNKGKGFALAGLSAAVILLVTGCRTSRGPEFDPRAAAPTNFQTVASERAEDFVAAAGAPTNLFTLGPGDVIEIEIFGDAASRSMCSVGPDGRIYYFLLPGLDVWGLTLEETRRLLESRLGEYVANPNVGVTLREIASKRIWLLGRFQKPGIYPAPGHITLLEAISLAGGVAQASATGGGAAATTGPPELGDWKRAFIIRNGERLPVNFHDLLMKGDMRHNIHVQTDDFVYLPSSASTEIYVLGAVRSPQAVRLPDEPTLAKAVALAGGTIKDAYESHVAIVRGSLEEPEVAIVNYQDIVHGRASDVLLQSRDIVYVPFSPYRILNKYVDLILTTFVRAVAINEGARAVSNQAGAVSVGISITP